MEEHQVESHFIVYLLHIKDILLSVPAYLFCFYLGLKKYTHYVIEVSASTLKGEGVRSKPVSILTEDDGKTAIHTDRLWL